MSRKSLRLLALSAVAASAMSLYVGGYTQNVDGAVGTPLPDLSAQSTVPRQSINNYGSVPVGVCSATFLVQGAAGEGNGGFGGKGGLVIGSIPVTAGNTVALSAGSMPIGGINGTSSIYFLVGGSSSGAYGGGAGSAFSLNNSLVATAGGGGGNGADFSATGGDAGSVGVDGGTGSSGAGGAGGSVVVIPGPIDATGGNSQAGAGGGGTFAGSAGTGNSGGGGGSNYNYNLTGTVITTNGTASIATGGKVEITYSSCPVPSQPGVISTTSITTSSVGVSFASAGEFGIPVTGYRYSVDGGSTQALSTTGTSTLTATISGLAPGASHTLSVQPTYMPPNIQSEVNRGQTQLGSARTFNVTIPLNPPTNLSATQSNGVAHVYWTNPADSNYSQTVITAQPGGQTCTTSNSTCTFSNLVSGVSYTFTGVGSTTNSVISSATSAVSNAITLADPTSTASNIQSELAYTGSKIAQQGLFALASILAGTAIVLFRRFARRRA